MTSNQQPTLVERLRRLPAGGPWHYCNEAADRIDELEREVERLKAEYTPMPMTHEDFEEAWERGNKDRWLAMLAPIRHALMHGQHCQHEDVVELFEAVTGERITTGMRCARCDGYGGADYKLHDLPNGGVFVYPVQCTTCQGTGYSERPTWMEERA